MKTKIRLEFSAPVTREIPGYVQLGSSIFLHSFKPIIQLIPLFNRAYYVLLFILSIINKNNNNRFRGLGDKTKENVLVKKGEGKEKFISILTCRLAQKNQALFLPSAGFEQIKGFFKSLFRNFAK